jgi:PGF-CTERM protein
VAADPQAGFYYPYLLYRPDTQQETARPLFVEPHNSPKSASRDKLITQLYQRAERYLRPAITLSLPGLIPGFPNTPEDSGGIIQALSLESLDTQGKRQDVATDAFPAETLRRVDRQLLSMIDDAQERLGNESYSICDEIHMDGFSASGSFCERFAFLHPTRVKSVSNGGSGASPLPLSRWDGIELPYPLGTADYQEWTGDSFNREAWTEIDQFIYIGEEDQPLPESDPRSYYPISYRYQDRAEAVYGLNEVTERLPFTRSVYDEAGANATFKVYDGIGHRVSSKMQEDIVRFHSRTSKIPSILDYSLTRSADQITVGETLTVTVRVSNPVDFGMTTNLSLYANETELKTVERDIEPYAFTYIEFNYTFDNPGSYPLSVNGQQVGEDPVSVVESTPTSTTTSTPTGTLNSSPQPSKTTSTTGPGFGVGIALAGLAGLSYLLDRDQGD